MSDWRTRLKDADAAQPKNVPAEDIQRIRSVVLAAIRQTASTRTAVCRRPQVIVAALVIIVAAGATALIQTSRHTNRSPISTDDQTVPGAAAVDATEKSNSVSDRQQLQFSTPGGTRIIWVFDPNFEVKGTLP
jgi:hypothetical protein